MLRATELTRTFADPARGEVKAVDALSLTVEAGEVFALLGPNGAGKTTTFRMLATLLRPDSERIELDGVDLVAEPVRARSMLAYVPAEAGLPPRLTPREAVRLFASIQGVDQARERSDDLLERLGASGFADTPCGQLSTGMKRRVVLARALVHSPRLLLLDEPTDGLDVQGPRDVLGRIRSLAEEGRAVLLSSHILGEVDQVAGRHGPGACGCPRGSRAGGRPGEGPGASVHRGRGGPSGVEPGRRRGPGGASQRPRQPARRVGPARPRRSALAPRGAAAVRTGRANGPDDRRAGRSPGRPVHPVRRRLRRREPAARPRRRHPRGRARPAAAGLGTRRDPADGQRHPPRARTDAVGRPHPHSDGRRRGAVLVRRRRSGGCLRSGHRAGRDVRRRRDVVGPTRSRHQPGHGAPRPGLGLPPSRRAPAHRQPGRADPRRHAERRGRRRNRAARGPGLLALRPVLPMRWRRILHIAWRDLRLVHAGKSWWRLPAIALALLLPAGALPLPSSPTAEMARAGGEIPAALEDQIEFRPRSPIQLSGEDPVVLRGGRVSVPLRAALDGLGGVGVTILREGEERRMPGRSLLVALLAISLLTGPLAESLPGERQRGTLETLLTAGVSRAELITGKWLAWTLATTTMTAIVAAMGMLDGSQDVGVWPLALPPVAGVAVAFGLWLGRGAADEIAGATRTMRVLPVTSVTLLVAAYALGTVHPALGALVPLGGALLVAGDVFVGALPLTAAWAGSLAAVVGLLAWTARDLTEVGLRRERIGDSAGLIAMAGLLWWLPVVGPVA
ncbi:MAG: ATP-binding cassette domain-containing protein [Proteobacteria bacterium]|nr:ATP-binding cassette domain-containing protein [Pseudomonadota bacterium]MCP4915484.1 ATP-binding cassette domain-containing protein [Pseudomonadota bacterium]